MGSRNMPCSSTKANKCNNFSLYTYVVTTYCLVYVHGITTTKSDFLYFLFMLLKFQRFPKAEFWGIQPEFQRLFEFSKLNFWKSSFTERLTKVSET